MEFLLLRRVLWRALSREPELLEDTDPFVVQSRLDGAVDVLVVEFAVAFFDRATEALAEQARTDALTGLLNHQAFWGDAAIELERAARYRHELTLVYLDVDDFKGINDRHGHPAGDRVLRAVAAVLLDEARLSDLVGRTGGDEFAVCLVESEADAGARFIARLRGRVAGLSLDRGMPPALSITAGAARFPAEAGNAGRPVRARRRAALRRQALQVAGQVVRQRRLDVDPLAGERVREREPRRVQELPPETGLGHAVDAVADDTGRSIAARCTRIWCVRPVSRVHAQQRVVAEHALDLEVRDGGARRVGVERLPRRLGAVAADRGLDRAAQGARPAAHERQIGALELVAADEPLQASVRFLRARDDEQARRVAVEAVDDARPLRVAAGGAVLQQAVHERPARVAGRRVDDDARRLVDDEQVLVLPGDAQVDVLGHQLRLGALGRLELELLPAGDPVALRARGAVHGDGAGGEQPLRLLARVDLGSAASTRSRRIPAASAGTWARIRPSPTARSGGMRSAANSE